MKVTITFPDEIAKKVCRLPDRDSFVTRAVADALSHNPEAVIELPTGEAQITIESSVESGWTSDELDRALEVVPLTGAEIVRSGLTGGWSHKKIAHGEDWVQEQRRQRREARDRDRSVCPSA